MKKYKLLKYSSEYFFNLGNENRKNAPSYNSEYDDEYHTIFDFNVDFFIKECMFNEPFTKKFFNKFMIMKIKNSSGFIFNYTNEPAKFIITNSYISSILLESSFSKNYNIISKNKLYKVCMISGISIYEDPTMNIDDKRILIGTINTTEQYNVAKYLGINCDDKYKTILRDNFINTNISYKPHMSFMTLKIKDENNNIVC